MSDQTFPALLFEISSQIYAVPLEAVEEVIVAVAIAPLPDLPDVVEGVINLRGHAVPVLNMRGRFRHPEQPVSPTDRFIVARASGHRVIVRADAVLDLRGIPRSAVTNTQAISPTLRYVAGVACLPDGIVLIHDLDTFLSAFEQERLAEALVASSACAPPAAQ